MGAVEHLKTLCCLGLPPESAMVAVVPLLHEIIPHGQTRVALLEPDASMGSTYSEHPGTTRLLREHLWRFMDDPSSPWSLWTPGFHAVGIGWSLHMQGRNWLDNAYYREIEAPLDSCWMLDAMIGDGERSIAFLALTRPRSARPFTANDVQWLDRLRPWLAHGLRRTPPGDARRRDQVPIGMVGPTVLSGQLIVTADSRLIYQTARLEYLLRILVGDPGNFTRCVPARDNLPAPVLKLLRQITDAANGASNTPPRMQVSTAYGVLALEAKWLVPAGTLAEDAAKDPKSCLIAVTIELREHAIAHVARVLRDNGATPAQTKVGIQLALGKTKPVIAAALGVQLSSVVDVTKKLYQNLDVHNSAELATKIWLGPIQEEGRYRNPPCRNRKEFKNRRRI